MRNVKSAATRDWAAGDLLSALASLQGPLRGEQCTGGEGEGSLCLGFHHLSLTELVRSLGWAPPLPHTQILGPFLPAEDKLWLKPYVDLQAYEDPAQGALDFTQELDPGCLIVDNVIGEGKPCPDLPSRAGQHLPVKGHEFLSVVRLQGQL